MREILLSMQSISTKPPIQILAGIKRKMLNKQENIFKSHLVSSVMSSLHLLLQPCLPCLSCSFLSFCPNDAPKFIKILYYFIQQKQRTVHATKYSHP